jgi:hypothetical protein
VNNEKAMLTIEIPSQLQEKISSSELVSSKMNKERGRDTIEILRQLQEIFFPSEIVHSNTNRYMAVITMETGIQSRT